MPCRSDYLEPTRREEELQRAARLYMFLLEQTGEKVPAKLSKTAFDIYASTDYVPQLCAAIRALDPTQLNAIVYDGRNKQSRELADWWDEHQEADRKREQHEKAAKAKLAMTAGQVSVTDLNDIAEYVAFRIRANQGCPTDGWDGGKDGRGVWQVMISILRTNGLWDEKQHYPKLAEAVKLTENET